MSRLYEIYKNRVKHLNIESPEDLHNLLRLDIKTFYFYLMYCYLSNADMSKIIDKGDKAVVSAISLFCSKNITRYSSDIRLYFNQYLDVDEYVEQISRIQNEIGIMRAKEKFEVTE